LLINGEGKYSRYGCRRLACRCNCSWHQGSLETHRDFHQPKTQLLRR
jgi:hypothetical protein